MDSPGNILSSILLTPWVGVLLALIVVSIGVSLISPYFLTSNNLMGTVALYLSWICIAAFGSGLVMIGGGLDLSVGSVMGLSGMTCALALTAGWPFWAAVVSGLLVGAAVGLANGLAITQAGLNPFITTLATLSMVRGLTYGIVDGNSVPTPSTPAAQFLTSLCNGVAWGVPYPVFIMLIMGLVFGVVLNTTPYGRRIYAIGGAESAARLLGLKVNAIKVSLYMMSGISAALGGILLLGKVGTALPDAAAGYELDVIAAVIVGGVSLSGGRGTIPGILIGVALLGVINNGVVLAGLAGYWQQFITGAVIALSVMLDVAREKWQRNAIR